MSRWWADAQESLKILALVDDSDVEQGVGTAVLGYHGLAAGALEPLTRMTLMDASAVRTALSKVDLEPVAKAFGEATRPIMGEASDHYGQLLARNLHTQAINATERLLLGMVSKGMAWPTAIERVATVHGVPLEYLGQAATKLGAPALAPLVRADIGDRALMEYAAKAGMRESVDTASISKALGQAEFDPNEHPRGQKGRFVAAPAKGEPVTADDELLARKRRRKRRFGAFDSATEKVNARREKAAASAKKVVETQQGFLSALRHAFGEPEQEEAPAAATSRAKIRRDERRLERRKDARNARRQPLAEQVQEETKLITPKATAKPKTKGKSATFADPEVKDYEYRVGAGERFALIPKRVADKLVDAQTSGGDGMSWARLEHEVRDQVTWVTAEEMQAKVGGMSLDDAYDKVVLYLDGDIPTSSSSAYDDEILMAPSARVQANTANVESFDGYNYHKDFAVQVAADPTRGKPATTQGMLTLKIDVGNLYDFGPIKEDAYSDNPPLPYDRFGNPEDVHKEWQFREADVKRDAKGQFAPEGRGGPDLATQDMLARRRRRRRRMTGFDRPRARAVAANPDEVTLAQIAHAIREDPLAQTDMLEARDLLEQPPASRASARRAQRRADAKNARREGAEGRKRNVERNASAQAPDLQGKMSIRISAELYNALVGLGDARDDDVGGGSLGDELTRLQQLLLDDPDPNNHLAMQQVDQGGKVKRPQVIPLNMDGSRTAPTYSDVGAYQAARSVLLAAGGDDGTKNPFHSGDDVADMMLLNDIALKIQAADGVAVADTVERTVNGVKRHLPAIRVKPEADDRLLIVGDADQITALLERKLIDRKEPQTWSNRALQEAAGTKATADKDALTRLIDLDW